MLGVLESLERLFSRFVGVLAKTGFIISSLAVLAMMIPTVVDVILRALSSWDWLWFKLTDIFEDLEPSIEGVIDIEGILMLVVVFGGLGWAKYSGGHIRVDLLFDFFPPRVKTVLLLFHSTLMSVFTALMTYYIYLGAMEKQVNFDLTDQLLWPLWPVYLAASVGSGILFLCCIRMFLENLVKALEQKMHVQILIPLAAAVAFCYLPFLFHDAGLAENKALLGALTIGMMLLLLLLRLPIGFCMGIMGIFGMIIMYPSYDIALETLASAPPAGTMKYVMTVVPMFVLMGEIALYSGISTDMFNSASMWLGRLPGGLAVAGVAGCAGFAAICGDSLATAMTMTSVALPEMKKQNYNAGLACSSLAAGGTLGILIPPSMGFIFYAIVTETSIGQLFIAGIVPGVMLAGIFGLLMIFIALKWPHMAPRGAVFPWAMKFKSLIGVLPMVGLVILILGGMMMGFFSPTEGGAMGAFGTLVYAVCRRRISPREFLDSLKSTSGITTRLMFILIGVDILNSFLAATQLPMMLAEWVSGMGAGKYTVLLLIVLFYIVLGSFMNVIPMILLTLPALFPTVMEVGFNPVWFGVVTVLLMEMGQITPPMGIVVFAIAGMPNTAPMGQIFKFIMPFVLCMMLMVVLLTIFPDIAIWLPKLLFGNAFDTGAVI